MKVIFNGKILYRKITGVERYARETLNKIDEIANTGEFILAIPESYDENILDFHNIRVMKVKGPRDGVWWDQITLPRYAKKIVELWQASTLQLRCSGRESQQSMI